MEEVHGYISGIRPRRAGKALIIEISISTLLGEVIDAVLHDPPDWLEIGSKISCKLERLPGQHGRTITAAYEVKPSSTLPDAGKIELFIETIRETPEGNLIVEGKKSVGGVFSYILKARNADLAGSQLPCKAVALKTSARDIDRIIAVLPHRNYSILKRAHELVVQLKEEEEKRPELDFLPPPL
ncbi:MAG: hypothetical protein QXO86_03120 [Nitrososphaerota archaeon]